MKHLWLYISNPDLETERRQCEEEGKEHALVSNSFRVAYTRVRSMIRATGVDRE